MTSLTMKRSASKNKAGRSVPHHQPVEDDSRTNCHQCSRRSESDKMRCSNERLANRECGLRYCKTCIEKHPDIFFDPNNDHFKCPRCEDRCLCAKCRGLRGERPTSPSGHVLKRASKHSTSSRSTGNKSRSPAVEKKSHSMQRPKINQKQKQVTSAPVEEKEEDYPEESVESEGEDDEDDEFDEDEEEETSIQPQAAPASHAPQLSLDFGTTNLQVIENRPVPLLSQGWHGLDEHLATPDEQSHEPQFTPRANFQSTALPTPPSSTSRPSLKVIFGGNEQRRSTGTLSGFARSRLFDSPRSKRRAATTESRPRAEVWVRGPADLSGSEASDSEIETDDKSLRNSKAGREGPRRTLSGLAQSFNQDSEDAGSFGGFKPSEAGSTYPYADSNPPHHEDHTFYGLSSSHGPEPWMQHSTHSEETSTAASSTSYLGSHDSDSGAYMNMSMDLDVDLDLRSPSQNERASSDYFSSSNVPDAFNRVSSPFKPSPFKSDYVYQDPFHQGNYFDYDQPFASSPETTAATSSSGRSSLGELEIGAPWGEALRMSSASISSGSGSGSSSQLSHGHSLDLSQSWHSSDDHGMMQLDLEDHQQPQQSNQSKNLQQTLPSSYDIDSHPELAALAFHLLHNPEKESSTPQTPSGMVMSVE